MVKWAHKTIVRIKDPYSHLCRHFLFLKGIKVIFRHDIQNRAIFPLKFPLKTKSDLPIAVMAL